MREIYVRTKIVNGPYVYAPKGTNETYGTILIDNDTLKYYIDSEDNKQKLKVDIGVINNEVYKNFPILTQEQVDSLF